MAIIMDREIRVVKSVEGQSVYDSGMPQAKRIALKNAQNGGYVASLPQILHSRVVSPANSEIWQNWFTANSEENIGRTAQGNPVVIAVHGTGLWTPDRIQEAYDEGLTPNYAGKLDTTSHPHEMRDLLNGKLADGTIIPVYSLTDFMKGISDLPMQYTVIMDFDQVKNLESGVQKTGKLRQNPLFIVRAGGAEAANEYLDKAEQVYERKELGNWHPFANSDPDQPQGRVPFAGDYCNSGLLGANSLSSIGRFVWVAPNTPSAQKNAERATVQPTMEQILAASAKYVPEINQESYRQEINSLYT
ncbi:MAG: hypothetical protein ABIJ21_01000 [Nanoarchaeota archaeon]